MACEKELTLKEYAEHLKDIGRQSARLFSLFKSINASMQPPSTAKLIDQAVPNLPSWTFPQLCKDAPDSDSFYAHAYCWIIFVVYALLVVSLIIYQLRSILWLKKELPKRQKNEHKSNQQNIELESPDETRV
jgi:hypothetical protein